MPSDVLAASFLCFDFFHIFKDFFFFLFFFFFFLEFFFFAFFFFHFIDG